MQLFYFLCFLSCCLHFPLFFTFDSHSSWSQVGRPVQGQPWQLRAARGLLSTPTPLLASQGRPTAVTPGSCLSFGLAPCSTTRKWANWLDLWHEKKSPQRLYFQEPESRCTKSQSWAHADHCCEIIATLTELTEKERGAMDRLCEKRVLFIFFLRFLICLKE